MPAQEGEGVVLSPWDPVPVCEAEEGVVLSPWDLMLMHGAEKGCPDPACSTHLVHRACCEYRSVPA